MLFAQSNRRVSIGIDAARRWPIAFVVVASILFALVLGLFLVVRRVTGELVAPLGAGQLVIAATLLLAWALVVRELSPGRFAVWPPAAVLSLFAVACSFPGERAVDWLVWLPVFGALMASHSMISTSPARRILPAIANEYVLQHLTRSRTIDGHDIIHGTLTAEFAPGERTATLHVAFCPPFERLPHVELESSADVKLLQTLHNGAQLEVRRPSASGLPTTIVVELFATDAE